MKKEIKGERRTFTLLCFYEQRVLFVKLLSR